MKPIDFVSTNKNFQTSVNIEYDLGMADKIRSLIPTDTVCRYLEDILKDVMTASPNRAKSLVAPYGTGKSHITLAALSSMWIKDDKLYKEIVDAYSVRGSEFAENYAQFVSNGLRLLPVVVSGSSADLRHSLLNALRNALRNADLEQLMPRTNYDGALAVLDRWQSDYPETLSRFEKASKVSADRFRSNLRNMDTRAYNEFVSLYPKMSSGGSFDDFEGADVIGIYESVLDSLKSMKISGIYVVYDEFSKYLEANITSATVEDVKLLQDFAERCTRSSQDQQLHLLLISHKTLTNYIDTNLPKNKRDGWNGVSGRFQEIEIRSDLNQSYELISHAIIKERKGWSLWLQNNEPILESIKARYLNSKSSELLKGIQEDYLIYGCYPLHPISACILPRLSSKVAQNERTLFTFICASGESSFSSALTTMDTFISPDVIYDYFEPLIKKEYYSTEIKRIYSLAKKAIDLVSDDKLCEQIIKTIALVYIIDQPRLVRPTEQVMIEVFSDCGKSTQEIKDAISKLVNTESVIYQRDSNGYLKLKESSGVNIEDKIKELEDSLSLDMKPCEILNSSQLANAIYPSEHNEVHSIIRYFDCGFIPVSQLSNGLEIVGLLGDGDGAVVAAFPSSADELDGIEEAAINFTKIHPLSVVVVLLDYFDIEKYLYRYAAAKALKEKVDGDSVLSEEYGIVVDDSGEIINDYIDGYFQPELRRAKYFAGGKELESITRRRLLSDKLSNLCEQAFPYTPRITHETLNKNEMTGAGRSSRLKLLTGLCAPQLSPNFGIVGTGQEMAMASSALRATKVIDNFEAPVINLEPENEEIRRILGVIEEFVTTSNGDSFETLYERLMGQEGKIGMKKGPISVYLSLVLRLHSDEVVITYRGEERPFSAELIQDIDSNPSAYKITQIDWTEEKSEYTKQVARLFNCEESFSRAKVADAMRRWYVMLPQLTRNAQADHTGLPEGKKNDFSAHRAFLGLLKKTDIDSNQLLFEEIPQIFGKNLGSKEILSRISQEKEYCDRYIENAANALCETIKETINPAAYGEASLYSVIQDWRDSLPAEASSFVYSGLTNTVFSALWQASPDDISTVKKIAREVTSLHIEDWNDERFKDFASIMQGCRHEIDETLLSQDDSKTVQGRLSICYYDGGKEQTKIFDSVSEGKYAGMLQRSITACLDEMGSSISSEEKRQVVFNVLRSLC